MKFIITLLFSFLIITLSAQTHQRIYLGIKSGINIPGLSYKSSDPVVNGYKTTLNPYLGVVLEAGLNDKCSVLSEYNYSTIGITKNGSQIIPQSIYGNLTFTTPSYLYADFYSKIKISYIQLPIMLKYYFHEDEQFNFFINGGPFVGIATKAQVNTDGFDVVYTDEAHTKPLVLLPTGRGLKFSLTQDKEVMSLINTIDWGLQGGVGVTYKGEFGELFCTVGGNVGFQTLQINSGDGENKTKALTMAVGYLIHLSK